MSGSLVGFMNRFQVLAIFHQEINRMVEYEKSLSMNMLDNIEDIMHYGPCKTI